MGKEEQNPTELGLKNGSERGTAELSKTWGNDNSTSLNHRLYFSPTNLPSVRSSVLPSYGLGKHQPLQLVHDQFKDGKNGQNW